MTKIEWANDTIPTDGIPKMFWAHQSLIPEYVADSYDDWWAYLPNFTNIIKVKWNDVAYMILDCPRARRIPSAFSDHYGFTAIYRDDDVDLCFTSEEEMTMAMLKYPDFFTGGELR